MSLECIEGAYAACLGDKRITGTQMATLICLCWHANPKSRECFPSTERISQMTHFGRTAVEDARRGLRELGLIDWLPGGQDPLGRQTNRYYFKFPMQKMRDVNRSRYETALERHQAVDNSKYPPYTPPASRGEGSRLAGGGDPSGGGEGPATRGQKENENETKAKSMVARTAPISAVDISTVAGTLDFGADRPVRRPRRDPNDPFDVPRPVSVIDKAMRACGVKDVDNRRAFIKVMLEHDKEACKAVVEAFQEEIYMGKHKDLRNRAAYLMTRLRELPRIQEG